MGNCKIQTRPTIYLREAVNAKSHQTEVPRLRVSHLAETLQPGMASKSKPSHAGSSFRSESQAQDLGDSELIQRTGDDSH